MLSGSDTPLGHAFADACHEPIAIGVLAAIAQRNQTCHFAFKIPLFV